MPLHRFIVKCLHLCLFCIMEDKFSRSQNHWAKSISQNLSYDVKDKCAVSFEITLDRKKKH